VLAVCGVAALLAVAIVTLPQQASYQRIANLTGPGNASGYVAVGPSAGATEPVVVSVAHLHPAPAGSYYQVSFQTRGRPVPGAVFDVAANGTAVVRLNAPAHTRFVRCWVTTAAGTVVMKGTSALSG
jgi:hypothetical protein